MNADRFNPGTASKSWLREVDCTRMNTARPVELLWRVVLSLVVDPGHRARVTRTASAAASSNIDFKGHTLAQPARVLPALNQA